MAINEISATDLAEQVAGGALVVDVREPDEYEDGHIEGAVLVPLSAVPEHVDAFRGDGPTYVICRSGARSMRACEYLDGFGLEVVNVAGGMLAWSMAGHAVATGAS